MSLQAAYQDIIGPAGRRSEY